MIGAPLPFDVREMPVSVLAYIGDAVYELYVRLHVAQEACGGSGDLHRKSIGFVSARSQAEAMRRLLPLLTEAEASVYRRSRNHQSGSLPKNADPVTYRIATGFEGLVGYLYLRGEQERLDALLQIVFQPAVETASPSAAEPASEPSPLAAEPSSEPTPAVAGPAPGPAAEPVAPAAAEPLAAASSQAPAGAADGCAIASIDHAPADPAEEGNP